MKSAFGILIMAAALMVATSEDVLSKGGGNKPSGGGGGSKSGGGKKGGNWGGAPGGGGYYPGYNGSGDADDSSSELAELDRRYLAVNNKTGEPLTVFLQYYTLTSKGTWQWFPSRPQESKIVSYKLEPDRITKLLHDDWPISASKVRIWARTKSGIQMNEFQNQDLLLVPEPGQVYYAPDTGTFTFTFERGQLAQQNQESKEADAPQTAEEQRWLKELLKKATTQQRKDLEQAWRAATSQERREFYLKNGGGTAGGSAKGDR